MTWKGDVMESTPTAGENIAVLRKARGTGQAKLARQAGISLSYLSKIEAGHRPATPPVIAAIAKVLHVTTARINGQPFLGPSEQADLVNELRGAVRRNTLPREDQPSPGVLTAGLEQAAVLRADARYRRLRAACAAPAPATCRSADRAGCRCRWCR